MDDLARLTELRRSDPDIELMCNIVVAKMDCGSVERLQKEFPKTFAELMLHARGMADLDPEPGTVDEWPVQ